MRRALLVALALAAVVITAAVVWNATREDNRWVVSGRTADYARAQRACEDLPGIKELMFSTTSDMPVGSLSEGVHWLVEGRDNAAEVALCLESNGVPQVAIEREREPLEFEKTGP